MNQEQTALFDRENYYSQTEILKTFKISAKKLNELLITNYVPVKTNLITYGNYYSLTAKYYPKTDIDLLLNSFKI
jgi:hypothetical protein